MTFPIRSFRAAVVRDVVITLFEAAGGVLLSASAGVAAWQLAPAAGFAAAGVTAAGFGVVATIVGERG